MSLFAKPVAVHVGRRRSHALFRCTPRRCLLRCRRLEPAQIKQILDTHPWSQEVEDKFRGVDGRKVVDHDALFDPPDHLRPPRHTKEEYERKRRQIEEHNNKLRDEIEKERR